MPQTPTHELFVNKNGTTSIREIASGEVMHSNVGPREEATLLYIEQSGLAQRFAGATNASPLVLLDLGLGAATNALAALQCHARQIAVGPVRPLRLISFENDLSGLRLAYANKERFPFFEGFEQAVETLLEKGQWQAPNVSWELREGDFFERLTGTPPPEVIFFDFYSPNVASRFWSVETFKLLYNLTQRNPAQPATLYTYSASTRVRAALLVAGFFVGYGRNTGAKIETTVASTRLGELERPLDARWITRFKGSHVPLPHGWPVDKANELFELVLNHPQFKSEA